MQEVTDSIEEGDIERQKYAQSMVDCFTMQLNESNPILTTISDAMTEEGEYKDKMNKCIENNQIEEASILENKMKTSADKKLQGNEALMECSTRYKNQMKTIRESRQKFVLDQQ